MKITTKHSDSRTRTNTESTDMLARLLASEDLTVQHSASAFTAMMDVENRVLTLPVWEEMSGSLYDMLVMHEVGHALFTPANGWSDCAAIDSNENNWPIVQMFYNIVEDARIERLMQDKFPGGRADFEKAYTDLHENRDMFELAGKNIAELGLADRINVHFKLGQFGLADVAFSAIEQVFVDAINAATTWDDVTEATRALYEYCKEQDKNNPATDTHPAPAMPQNGDAGEGEESDAPQQPSIPNFDHGDEDKNEDEGTGMPQSSDEDGDEDGEQGAGAGEGEDSDDESADSETGNGSDDDENGEDSGASMEDDTDDGESADSTEGENGTAANQGEGSETGDRTMSKEIPSTVDAQNRNMEDLRDNSGRDFAYYGTPEVDPKMIKDYSEIHIDNATFIKKYGIGTGYDLHPSQSEYKSADASFANFINRNRKTVNKMAQQFEMKKAADVFKRTRLSKSGRLDTNKMINYRWSEDIFAKNETITDGKNHGLVMYVDWSGSMSGCMKNTIEQMLCLVLFCKKVNIPFEVYSFTSVNPDESDNHDRWGRGQESSIKFGSDEDGYRSPSYCILNNYMSSRMKKSEYVNAMKNMIVLAEGMDTYGRRGRHDLGGTPLNECILAARDIMLKFKQDNNVQIAHTVFLTDGEACGDFLHGYRTTTVWKERKHNWSYTSNPEERQRGCTEIVLDWYKTTTGSRVVNFFITQSLSRHFQWNYFSDDVDGTQFKQAKKTFTKENMISVGAKGGYDETFLIKSNVAVNNETGLENIDTDATAARLRNAFIKGQNARVASRQLLNRFTDLIAD